MKVRQGRQRGLLVEGLESRVLLSTAHDAGAAVRVIFKSRPGNQGVGSKFGFTVAVVDSHGATVTGEKGNVTLTFVGPSGALINGTKKVALHNGVGTFNGLSVTGAGVYKIRVSESSTVTTNSPLVIGVAGLVISPPTSGGWLSAGSLTLGDPVQQVTSSGTVTGKFLAMNGGNVTIEMGGTGTFDTTHVITDMATGATLTPVFLGAGAVPTGSANVTLLPTASWTFSSGVFSVGDTVQQAATSNGSGVASGVFLGSVNGNYEIEVTSGRFISPGTITDTNSNATLKTTASNVTSSSTVTVSALPVATPFVLGTAGAKTNVIVQVLGANGTVSTNDHSKVSLVVAAGAGAGSTLATVTAVHGVATFSNVTLTRAGVFSLKGVSGKQSSLPTSAITINPGPAYKLNIVSTFPPDTAARRPTGSLGPIVVQILDTYGNVVTSPAGLTLAPSTSRGWTANGTLKVNDRLVQTTTSNGTTTTGSAVFLGKDANGNFQVRVTSGTFNNTTVITDTTTGATLTPNGAAAFPSSDSTVTATVNTTLGTATVPGKITQAANGTATSVNGVANITLTSTAGTTGTLLGLKPGYYTLIVSDGTLIGEQFQVHVS